MCCRQLFPIKRNTGTCWIWGMVEEWGWRDWTWESFPSYLGLQKHVRPTVARSPYTTNFIDFRVNSLIYLFSADSLKVSKAQRMVAINCIRYSIQFIRNNIQFIRNNIQFSHNLLHTWWIFIRFNIWKSEGCVPSPTQTSLCGTSACCWRFCLLAVICLHFQ